MNTQAGWAKAGNYGIAAMAVAIIISIGLFFTGVIAPVDVKDFPDPQADVATDSPSEQTTDTATNDSGQSPTAAEDADADEVAALTPAQPQDESAAAQPTQDEQSATDEAAGDSADDVTLPAPPVIDVVRLENDGGMLVAGQTQPGWDTWILVDGEEFAHVTADASGEFVEFLDLQYSDQPRVLSLLMRGPDGAVEIASSGEVILAPTQPATETVAQAEADKATETPLAQSDQPEDQLGPDNTSVSEDEPGGSQAVLLADESGVRVLQPPKPGESSPEVMSTVALDAITYSDAGQVQLAGRAIGSGSVRVYLDNAPIITTNIAEDGNWRSELPQVDTGVYTLRVDELDDQGRVTSRVETPFKREDEEVLAEASAGQATSTVRAVTVQPGSTLWAISREAYGEGILYVRVFEANSDRIRDPDLIYPGQVFNIPE